MKCAKCGFELNENANFCSNCGAPVERVQQSTPAPEITPEADTMDTDESWDPEDEEILMDQAMESDDEPESFQGQIDDDDDDDYDDFAYQERRAKRLARKKKKAREKVILFALVGVILVGALAFILFRSLSGKDTPEASQTPQSSVAAEQPESSVTKEVSSVVETEDPNKLSVEELTAAVDEIQQKYEAIMSKRTAGEYKASAYKTGITAYWDGDSRIDAIMAESGTEGSDYARSYFYDENGNLAGAVGFHASSAERYAEYGYSEAFAHFATGHVKYFDWDNYHFVDGDSSNCESVYSVSYHGISSAAWIDGWGFHPFYCPTAVSCCATGNPVSVAVELSNTYEDSASLSKRVAESIRFE